MWVWVSLASLMSCVETLGIMLTSVSWWVWVFVSMVPCSLDKTIDNCEYDVVHDECLGSVYLLILGKELFSGLTNGNRYSCVRCPDYPYVMFLARCHPANRYSGWGAWDGNECPEGPPANRYSWWGAWDGKDSPREYPLEKYPGWVDLWHRLKRAVRVVVSYGKITE